MSPPTVSPPPSSISSSSPSSSVSPPPTASAFPALSPADLPEVLADPHALILDIRPFNAYATARLPRSLSLSVPSTLLKRPTYPLARLAPMISSTSARDRFTTWPHASRILIHDADAAALPERPTLLGLLRKFRAEGYDQTRQVAWLRGGINAVWRERSDLLDHSPLPDEGEEEDDVVAELAARPIGLSTSLGPPASTATGSLPEMSKSSSAPASNVSFAKALRTKTLPMSAFTSASTLAAPRAFRPPPPTSVDGTVIPPTPAVGAYIADPFAAKTGANIAGSSLLAARASKALNPPSAAFNLRLPAISSAPGSTMPPPTGGPTQGAHPFPPMAGASSMPTLTVSPGGFPSALGGPRQHRYSVPHGRPVAFNPFFDAIRQNLELARGADGTEDGVRGAGIALRLPRRVRRRVGDLPFEWLREIARRSGRATESSSDSEIDVDESDDSATEKKVSTPRREMPAPVFATRHDTSRHPPPLKARATDLRSTTPPSSPPSSPSHSPLQLRHSHRPHSQTLPAPKDTRPGPPAVLIKPKPKPKPFDGAAVSPDDDGSSSSASPPSAEDLTRALELQFYRIELGEQRRLMGVMEHHSMESQSSMGSASMSAAGIVPVGAEDAGKGRKGKGERAGFPFSITAGLEKGDKNRYGHIWPFEHARVRLCKTRPEDDDYMNASYVQPLGTTKRYIATQGPLASTFIDFWTLCWEQNVHVIVMLTREIEGNTVKCGKYWAEGEYGPLRLKLIATDDTPERERLRREKEMSGGFFSAHVPPPADARRHGKSGNDVDDADAERDIVRRVFKLTHTGYPQAEPRIVTQLQYLDWPDFNVPQNPCGVLDLIHEVEEAVARSRQAGDKMWGEGPMYPGPWPSRVTIPTLSPPREQARSCMSSTFVRSVAVDDNDVEPVTGVACHAVGNPPVLLHCSAGVGRTGGYIAVDAILDGIRRDMRKRREEAQADADRMDVDPSPSPPSSGEGPASQSGAPSRMSSVGELTVPVSVGGDKVHVRVAGFAEPMDVDEEKPDPGSAGAGKAAKGEIPRAVLPASPDLLDEVRRASMSKWPSASRDDNAPDRMATPGKDWETSSSDSSQLLSKSGTPSTRKSVRSTAPSRSDPSTQSTSPLSSQAGSSTNLSAAMSKKVASVTDTKEVSQPAPTFTALDSPKIRSTDYARQQKQTVAQVHASRLDSWRSEVRPSDLLPKDKARSSKSPGTRLSSGVDTDHEGTVHGEDPHFHRGRAFDYAQPRRLHQNLSPPLLSTYDEPIRSVIEDMREQRMSLCQSLRQYVFVYRAVIEGALAIVDDERETEERVHLVAETGTRGQSDAPFLGTERQGVDMEEPEVPQPATPERPIAQGGRNIASKRSISDYVRENVAIDGQRVTMSPGGTKRGASPTELQMEDVQGGALLAKRPSIKRISRLDVK